MSNTFEQNLLNNLMETWILPSVQERQATGELEKPLRLTMAQIIFSMAAGKPSVRINGEVKGKMIAKLSDKLETPVRAGDPVFVEQLSGIEAFELSEGDSDHGHATLIFIGDKWLIAFNFIYNKKASQAHLSAAKEFLYAANASLDGKFVRAAIDNLHSASELASKAYLLGRPDKTVIEAKSHDVVHRKINYERKLGNVEGAHVDAFNRLRNLRAAARYLHSDLNVNIEEIVSLSKEVEDYIAMVNKFSEAKL